MSKIFWKLVGRLLVLIVFFVTLFVSLFFANGYRFDLARKNILVTSIIDLSYPGTSSVNVKLDGKKVADSIPNKLFGITLGKHFLELNKTGFYPWKIELTAKENLVSLVDDIFLWPENLSNYLKLEKIFKDNENVYFSQNWIIEKDDDQQVLKAMEIAGDLDFENGFKPLNLSWKANLKVTAIRANVLYYKLGNGPEKQFDLKENKDLNPDNNHLLELGNERIWYSGTNLYLGVLSSNSLDIKKKFDLKSNILAFRIVDFGNNKLLKVAKADSTIAWLKIDNNDLAVLSENVVSGPVYSDYQGLIWLEKSGNLWQQDPFGKKNLLARLNDPINLIGCFSEEGLLLFTKNNNYYLADRTLNNVVKIAAMDDFSYIFNNKDQVFMVDGLEGKLVGEAIMLPNIKPGQINFDPVQNKSVEIFSINPFKF